MANEEQGFWKSVPGCAVLFRFEEVFETVGVGKPTMNAAKGGALENERELSEKIGGRPIQTIARPNERASGIFGEERIVQFSAQGRVMIPQNEIVNMGVNLLEDGIGGGTVTHHIAKAKDPISAACLDIEPYRLPCRLVGVKVGNDGQAHGAGC